MGIKLVKLAYMSCLFLLACNASKRNKASDFSVNKEDYIKSYKVAFICGCINEGTKEKLANIIKENNDLGLFTEVEVMSHQKVKEADSIGRTFSYKIKPLNYGDANNKKPIISRCIYYSLSNEVDSLAKASYRSISGEKNKN